MPTSKHGVSRNTAAPRDTLHLRRAGLRLRCLRDSGNGRRLLFRRSLGRRQRLSSIDRSALSASTLANDDRPHADYVKNAENDCHVSRIRSAKLAHKSARVPALGVDARLASLIPHPHPALAPNCPTTSSSPITSRSIFCASSEPPTFAMRSCATKRCVLPRAPR